MKYKVMYTAEARRDLRIMYHGRDVHEQLSQTEDFSDK